MATTVTCGICNATVPQPPDGICPECGIALDAAPAPSTPPAAPAAAGSGRAQRPTACPVCAAALAPGAQVCDDCGVNIQEAMAVLATPSVPAPTAPPGPRETACPSCGAARRPGARFCRECGTLFPDADAAPDEILSAGEFLGTRYRVERKLGGGGMGAVYLARDLNLQGKPVAVKAVLNTSDPVLLQKARQEAETLIGLDHPNIVKIKDIVPKGNIPFIVMEYLEGPDWNHQYEDRVVATGEAFTAEEALDMILGIMPAFVYLHSRKPPIVYRDFKPGQVKSVEAEEGTTRHVLLDLGVAYRYSGQPVEAWGTVGYAPPEIGGICLQPPQMDLATICRTLEALLGIDLARFGYGQLPPRESVPWIPEELYYLIERGTALDPTRRFQTVEELQSQLEGVRRLIKGRQGSLPRPVGHLPIPVASEHMTDNFHRTTGRLVALPRVAESDPAAATLRETSALLLEGKSAEALQQVEAVLETNPGSTNARLLRAAALAQMNQADEAQRELQALSQQVDVASDWAYALVAAQVAEDAGQIPQAEEYYRGLIRILPGEIAPRQKLAALLQEQGRHQEAAALYEIIVGADPANAEAIIGWAESLEALGRFDQAVEVLSRVSPSSVRYVDAQLRLISLLLSRSAQNPGALSQAAAAVNGLAGRTESPRYARLIGDWWYAWYQMAKRNGTPAPAEWPGNQPSKSPREAAARARDAYRRYLRVAPAAPDADEVIGRIHFGIAELM